MEQLLCDSIGTEKKDRAGICKLTTDLIESLVHGQYSGSSARKVVEHNKEAIQYISLQSFSRRFKRQ